MKFSRCVFLALIASLLFSASSAWTQSVEYLRPTTDVDPGTAVCSDIAESSLSMSAVYSGKSGVGPTGSEGTQTVLYNPSDDYGKSRIFGNWQSATETYSSLTLNYSGSCSGTGSCSVDYSTNGGSTWAGLSSSVVITGTTLANLKVRVCADGSLTSGTTQLTTNDIWTTGTPVLISQGITFTAPATPVSYGVTPITIVATGGASGNPVVFSVLSGPGTVSGNVLTVTGVGTIVVAADQAGNSTYSAAPEVTRSVVVNQASQTIDFTAPASPQSYGASPIGLSATANSGLTPTFSIISGPGSISGNTLTMTGEGTIVIAANQAGNANYAAAPQVEQSVVVSLPGQTISFTAPLTEPYGAAPITLTATATSSLTVTFSVLSGPATLSGSTLTFTGAGTVIVAANQAGNSSYSAASQVTQTITVEPASGAQPQTQLAPISAVNAKYVQGVGPGFWPTAGSGLSVTLTAGTANCAGTIENYSATALALTASTTNYVYLNTATSCAPAVKTSAFTSSDIPIATIVTGTTSITSIQDDRTMFQSTGAAAFDIAGAAAAAQAAAEAASDPAGSAATAQSNAEAYARGVNTTGTAAGLSGTPALPNGTTATTQITGDATIKVATDAFVAAAVTAAGAYTLPAATSSTLGGVKPDGVTITNTAGAIACATASTTMTGCAKLGATGGADVYGAASTAQSTAEAASDPAGSAATAQSNAEAYAANSSNQTTGTVASARLPAATTSAQGTVILPSGASGNTLGTAAMAATTAFDASGAAATAQSNAETASDSAGSASTAQTNAISTAEAYAANSSNQNSGTLANARLAGFGVITVNGQTCTLGSTCTAGATAHAIVTSDMANVVYTASQIIGIFYAPVGGTVPASGTGTYNGIAATSFCKLATAATASTTFTFADNGTSFGTVAFAASGTTGTFTISSAKAIASGDKITLTAPATADATAAGLNCSLVFAY